MSPIYNPTSGITKPTSSTDNAIVRWDGTTGTVIQDSAVLVSDVALQEVIISTPNHATAPNQLSFLAGSATSGNNAGGNVALTAGAGSGTEAGGQFDATAGDGGATGGGGTVTFNAGNGGGTSGPGGSVTFVAGTTAGGNSNGGDIIFRTGALSGSGRNGQYQFRPKGGAINGILDFDSLATSDKTFTFPNSSGTIALTGLAGTKVYYVADTSGGAVTRKLTFTNGILTSET